MTLHDFTNWVSEPNALESFIERVPDVVERMLAYTLRECSETKELMEFYKGLSPEKMTNRAILAEISWIIYSSGFRFDIIKKYWSAIREAFHQFDVTEVANWSNNIEIQAKRVCGDSGFKNLKKAKWCIQNAQRIVELNHERKHLGGLKGYFIEISRKSTYELVKSAPRVVEELSFKGIGDTTVFHLMKNVGINIFKPDIHVRRILTGLGLIAGENVPTLEICRAMMFLSLISGMKISELDTLLFVYGRITGDCIDLCMQLSSSHVFLK